MALPYLTLATFRARTIAGDGEVAYVEADSPGFVVARIAIRTSWIHQRLRKRYGKSLPFGDPVPEIILGWLTSLVTLDVLRKRGLNPQDPTAEMFAADALKAEEEIKEAADSKEGLFDIETATDGGSGVTTGGPLGYSETSPYVSFDRQWVTGRTEDGNHSGSGDE